MREVTIRSPQNVYRYNSRNLLIAYGAAVLLTSATTVVGMLCIRHAASAYSAEFSTILRTTRNPELDLLVPAEETTGAEPLPRQLAATRVVLRRQSRKTSEGDEAVWTSFAVDPEPDEMASVYSNAYGLADSTG